VATGQNKIIQHFEGGVKERIARVLEQINGVRKLI
jgi:hypothetical protein